MFKKIKKHIIKNSLGYWLLLPATILLIFVSIIPFLNGLRLSMMRYTLFQPGSEKFVFLENIFNILTQDTEFFSVLGFTFIYTFLVVFISYIIGLVLAIFLNKDIKFKGIFRALVLAPWVVPSAVAATNWIWILNDQIGFVNVFLQNVGLISRPILFLSDTGIAKITVIMVSAWKSFPFMTIVLLAGLTSIPKELYEAAKIDGAGVFQRFYLITLPLLKNVSLICTLLMFIWTFNNFGNIYLLTQGGPAKSTFTLSILTYYTAFFRGRLGYSSAIAVVMLVVLLILSLLYLRFQRKTN